MDARTARSLARFVPWLMLATAPCLPALAGEAAGPAATVEAHWQSVPLEFNYSGFTTLYSCYGLEDKVKLLLRTLGAREGAKVVATGCDSGTGVNVSRFAFVHGEFQVLLPGPAADPAQTVQATWKPVEVRADHPLTVGEGDCELIEQLKPVVDKGAWLREASYVSRCVPHTVNPNSFSVKAQALEPARPSGP